MRDVQAGLIRYIFIVHFAFRPHNGINVLRLGCQNHLHEDKGRSTGTHG